jgi:hypothetical protein
MATIRKEDKMAKTISHPRTIVSEKPRSSALHSNEEADLSDDATSTTKSSQKMENIINTSTTSEKTSQSVVRIPDVVSAEFGRPLEVVATNVEPLRQLSKRDLDIKDEKTGAIALAFSEIAEKSQSLKGSNDISKRGSESHSQVLPGSPESKNPASVVESNASHEMPGRKILGARLQQESEKDPTTVTTFLSDHTMSSPKPKFTGHTLEDDTLKREEESHVRDERPLIDQAPDIEKTESKVQSMESIRKILSQPPTNHSQLSISKISERRLKSIIEARRQPKSIDEEASIAKKYAKMSVEDKAFAILFDLGMIDVNIDPLDPSYDHDDDDDICEQLHYPL